jgi:alpha-mannosidase
MLENYARIKEFPLLPRLRMGRVEEFYASLPARESLPSWVGELYLELHRGTLTSQAKTKALNRASEHRLLEAEAFGAIASLDGFAYPGEKLEQAWKTLLLNQFHDILPGSSITEVYQDTHRLLGEVVETATSARNAALASVGGDEQNSKRIKIAHAGLAPRRLQVVLSEISDGATITGPDGIPLATQSSSDGLIVAGNLNVPGLGWSTLDFEPNAEKASIDINDKVSAISNGGGALLENESLRVEIGADGAIARVVDKTQKRAALSDRGNQLWAYVDKPYSWDAWDVDETYARVGEEITSVDRIEIVEEGPLRASVRVERSWRDSRIIQTYRLWTESKRLDIETEIDWHERRVLLKALFPLNVRTHEATYETMYGAVQRPTHRNTSWDAAKFEVGAQRFADLSEPGYGVALLNDGKYGYGAHGNVLNISLLRSPMYPDVYADEGEHHFTYSLLPHAGDWTSGGVVDEAFALNSPLIVAPAGTETAGETGFVQSEGLPVALGSLKVADVGEGVVLRIYEPHGARGAATLRFNRDMRRVERVNLLEELDDSRIAPDLVDSRTVHLELAPFEIASLRLVF